VNDWLPALEARILQCRLPAPETGRLYFTPSHDRTPILTLPGLKMHTVLSVLIVDTVGTAPGGHCYHCLGLHLLKVL